MMNKHKYLHSPGGSCACVAWSGIFRHMGHHFSESDIFGLGSGIYYGYFALGNSKTFNISLISPSVVSDLLTNLGICGKLSQISNSQKALELLIKSLDNGIPIACQLNPNFCDGLINIISSDLLKYLPAHWIVVAGYDIDRETLLTYDNRQFNPVEISFVDFMKARNTGIGEQNPRNSTYNLLSFERLYPLKEATLLSLRKSCSNFLEVQNILAVYTGIYGLEKTIRQIQIWDKILAENQICELLQRIKMSITGAGGIKGGYRLLFSLYLERASEILQKSELEKCAFLFRSASELWNSFIANINETQSDLHNKNHWHNFPVILNEIKKVEEEGFYTIRQIIN